MALIDDFKARFPQFDDALVDQIFPIIENVWQCYFDAEYEGCCQEAILQLLAHLFVIETNTDNGPILQKASTTVGSVSESYISESNKSANEIWFGSTKYGQAFLRITENTGNIAFFA